MRIIAVSVCGIFVSGGLELLSLWRSQSARPPLQDDVKQVYLNKCSVCHGEDGAGKTAKGKKLKMKDIRAADVQKMTQAQWTDAIIKGSGQDMDGFGKELGAEMSPKLADYMRELAKK